MEYERLDLSCDYTRGQIPNLFDQKISENFYSLKTFLKFVAYFLDSFHRDDTLAVLYDRVLTFVSVQNIIAGLHRARLICRNFP